jgi:hypothetical protein
MRTGLEAWAKRGAKIRSQNEARFEIGPIEPKGLRNVKVCIGDETIFTDRFDVREDWKRTAFVERLAEKFEGEYISDPETGIQWRTLPWLTKQLDKAVCSLENGGSVSASTSAQREIISATPFPADVLPGIVGEFVCEAAAAIGCAVSFVALPVLACLARAIGNKRVVQLKRTWLEPAIIWCAIVGKSGTHKSPALAAATAILHRKQSEAIAEHEEHLRTFEQERAQYDRDYQLWKRSKSTEPPPWEPIEPALERYIVSDITIEALADRLHRQFDGVLVERDELAGWLGGIAEYKNGKGSDLGHWLASWSAAPLTVDRKTGAIKTVNVRRAAVNIVGGIQPGVLRSAIGREHMQDGLCARVLLAMPDPKPIRWTDTIVAPATEAAIEKIFERLLALEPAADAGGSPTPFAMPLTPEAKTVWVDYYNRHRAELADLDDDLAAAWSKLEAYAARFALIFQLCANAAGEANDNSVDEVSVGAGITLADWFGNEAKRVYGILAESDADREHRELVDLIRRKGGTVTARDLQRSSRRYQTSDDAEAALDSLAKTGAGHWEPIPTGPSGGKPTRRFTLVDTVDVDDTPAKPGKGIGYVNGKAVKSGNGHADPGQASPP